MDILVITYIIAALETSAAALHQVIDAPYPHACACVAIGYDEPGVINQGAQPCLKGFRFSRCRLIFYALWAYYRFALSLRDVEDMLAEWDVIVSCESSGLILPLGVKYVLNMCYVTSEATFHILIHTLIEWSGN